MKKGVVDVGGGLRGIHAAGVFDYCLDTGIQFDYCIGVSAGSANVASYLAGQKGRISGVRHMAAPTTRAVWNVRKILRMVSSSSWRRQQRFSVSIPA